MREKLHANQPIFRSGVFSRDTESLRYFPGQQRLRSGNIHMHNHPGSSAGQ